MECPGGVGVYRDSKRRKKYARKTLQNAVDTILLLNHTLRWANGRVDRAI